MTHRPATLITYRLIIAMRRKGMKRAAIAIALNMTDDAVRMVLYRVGKDRRKHPRPNSDDRRRNVDELCTDTKDNAA